MTRMNAQEKVNAILDELLQISNFNNYGREINDLNPVHINKLLTSIELNEKLTFIIPAFPAKSANRNKTLSNVPDMGEVEALRNLDKFARRISDIHGPGSDILVCFDGRVFSDLVGVTEEDVSVYRSELKKIVEVYSLKNIRFFDLEDEYCSGPNFRQMRDQLEQQFSKTESSIRNEVKNDAEIKRLFNGIHRFLKEDFAVIMKDVSRNQVSKISKQKAYKVVLRSNAWSELVERRFPNGFRLSIHPQDVSSVKFPIQLLPSEEKWGTPWHRVPVKRSGQFILMRNQEAIENGAVLNSENNYLFFEIGDAS